KTRRSTPTGRVPHPVRGQGSLVGRVRLRRPAVWSRDLAPGVSSAGHTGASDRAGSWPPSWGPSAGRRGGRTGPPPAARPERRPAPAAPIHTPEDDLRRGATAPSTKKSGKSDLCEFL